MSSSSKFPFTNIILMLAAIGVIVAAFFLTKHDNKPLRLLPIFGPAEYNTTTKDTDYHTVMNFKFTSEQGHIVTLDSFKHKIFVANFFYATCPGICKKMNWQLERANKAFAGTPYVKFISYTVDPVHDTVQVLAEYAKLHDAVPYQWYFLTGDKNEIYELARKSYYVAASDSGQGNFVHTDNMVLIDTAGHMRGIYKGTDTADVSRMVVEINLLLREEGLSKKQ